MVTQYNKSILIFTLPIFWKVDNSRSPNFPEKMHPAMEESSKESDRDSMAMNSHTNFNRIKDQASQFRSQSCSIAEYMTMSSGKNFVYSKSIRIYSKIQFELISVN